MPGTAAEESHPDRRATWWPAEELARHPHRVAQPEAQQVRVERRRRLVVGSRQYDVPEALLTGHEHVPVRADGRPVVQDCAAEDLDRVAGRILALEQLAYAPIG